MANLRKNLILSALAMLVVGVLRPAFHGIVNQTCGPEINGRAAAAISLFFLAALPAAAAWPTVVVRQVSRALGKDDNELARGRAALGAVWILVLGALGAVGAALYALFVFDTPAAPEEAVVIALATLGYCIWRFGRTLLLVVGRLQHSLASEVAAAVAMAAVLGGFIAFDQDPFVMPLAAFYLVYCFLVFRPLLKNTRGGRLEANDRKEFLGYGLLWSVGTATSLATREATLLVLDERVSTAQLGDASVALSLLMLLAFAPRIIEVPLTHELSALGGGSRLDDQRRLAETGMHWLSVLTLSLAVVAALMAPVILKFVGGVEDSHVILVFMMLLFAFGCEMMVSPVTNLLAAEAPPRALAIPGVVSLAAAIIIWNTPWAHNIEGVCAGLAASYVVKAACIGGYARINLGVRLFLRPLPKILLLIAAAGSLWMSAQNMAAPLALAAGFSVVSFTLFHQEVRAVLRAGFNRS